MIQRNELTDLFNNMERNLALGGELHSVTFTKVKAQRVIQVAQDGTKSQEWIGPRVVMTAKVTIREVADL